MQDRTELFPCYYGAGWGGEKRIKTNILSPLEKLIDKEE